MNDKINIMEKLNNQCKEIFRDKLNIMNTRNNISGKENIILELCEKDYLGLSQLCDYIPDLLNGLWEHPKIVASIIEKTNIDDLKNYLAPFFARNFYENILFQKNIEDNLMYVLTLLIKNEIMNLNNIVDKNKFLDHTPCSIMICELMQKSDTQNYLIEITKSALEYFENNNLENKITFDPDGIVVIKNNKKKSDSKNKKSKDNSFDEKNSDDEDCKEKNELFNEKYMINLDKSNLMRIEEENIIDKNMYEYLDSKYQDCLKKKKFTEMKNFYSFLVYLKNKKNYYSYIKNIFTS